MSRPARRAASRRRPAGGGVGRSHAWSRSLLLLALLALLVGTLSSRTGPVLPAAGDTPDTDPDTERPNVVVVMADDMRVDDLRFAPAVRRLVGDRGTTARNAVSSFPLCCPARASFLTGQYAQNHDVYSHRKPFGFGAFDDSRTVATAMSSAGYRTGFVGKYLNGYGTQDSLVSGEPSATYVPPGWDDWRATFTDPDPSDPTVVGDTYHYRRTPFNINGRVRQDWHGQYQTRVLGDHSLDVARRFSDDRARTGDPFFLYLSHVAPHAGGPREDDDPEPVVRSDGRLQEFPTPAVPPSVRGRFDDVVDRPAGVPRDGGGAEPDVSDKPGIFSSLPPLSPAERSALREVTRQRAESISVVDHQVGRLVRELKSSGEWERTVFVFVSDNGYFLGEHRQRTGKMKSHEPSLRVPLLVTGPGVEQGADLWEPFSLVDLAATLLDVADAEPPRPLDGSSRWASLTGSPSPGWQHPVVTQAAWGTRALVDGPTPRQRARGFTDVRVSIGLRTARYSYTRYKGGANELYDLREDPLQLENLARSEEYRPVHAELRRLWWTYKDCAGASCQVPLSPALRADAEQTAELGARYWRAVDEAYGWR